MDLHEVYNIMGSPDSVFKAGGDIGFFRLVYRSSIDTVDYVYLFIDDKDSTVQGIVMPDANKDFE